MRLVFICGTLEQGVDGVCDYVLRLASALCCRGIECFCISINDRYINSNAVDVVVIDRVVPIHCFRISWRISWLRKALILRTLLDQLNPDWISLNFVPYSFSRKGLPWGMSLCVASLRSFSRWHVMAHELWVDPRVSRKNRVLAFLQMKIVFFLFHFLKPRLFHSTNSYYSSQLNSNGFPCEVLPLFSNIELQGTGFSRDKVSGSWVLVFFGSIHQEWDPRKLLAFVESAAIEHGISSIQYLAVGLAGAHGNLLWRDLAAVSPAWITFRQLGPLPASEISRHLLEADFGVTTTPSHLVGKSGSVAAMLAHGLPVIVPRLDKTYGPWHSLLKADNRFILLDADLSVDLSRSSKYPAKDQLAATADQFLLSLMSAL